MTIQSGDWNGLTLGNGRYVITAKLGEGGMGSVYRALDRNIEADVVIKVPRPAMMEDPDFAGRFTREIRSLVKLSHPHIVKVTDVGVYEGAPFAVMQYLSGGTLDDQRPTAPEGRMLPCDPRTVPHWLTAVAQALDYVHGQGFVHRDVKPGNILFDGQGHAFLSDFGVAKVLASATDNRAAQTAVTGAGMVLGTPEYMAPELIMGESFDGRVDQYALAVTVYEILCGRRPFESDAKTKLLVLHTSKAPPRLSEVYPAIPEQLSQVVLIGLAKEPSERYANCVALAAAVSRTLENVALARNDGRVRLTCTSCGRSGSMGAADYARLVESGRRPNCPVCKAPMSAGGDVAAPAASPSGLHGALQGGPGPGAFGVATPTSRVSTPVGIAQPAPSARRGDTIAQRAPASAPPEPPVAGPPPAPAAKTTIERSHKRSGEDAATAVFGTLATSDTGPPRRPMKKEAVAPSAARDPVRNPRFWIAVGAAGGCVLLVAILAIAALMPRNAVQQTPEAPGSTAPRVASVTARRAKSSPTGGPSSSVSSPAAAAPAEPPSPKLAPATADPGNMSPAATRVGSAEPKPPDRAVTPHAQPSSPQPTTIARAIEGPTPADRSAPFATRPEPAPTVEPGSSPFDSALRSRKLVRAKGTLEKVLASLSAYKEQRVEPLGMYQLEYSPADRRGSARKYLITERGFIRRRKGGEIELGKGTTPTELDVEPGLAARLDALKKEEREERVAILTLAVSQTGAYGLVGVEILVDSYPHFRSGYLPDIEYTSLFVTPEGSKYGKGEDKRWEQTERMHPLAKIYKGKLQAMKLQMQDMQAAQSQAVMNNMWGQVMREAAMAASTQAALQRRLMGR
jgi:hypothetical protein